MCLADTGEVPANFRDVFLSVAAILGAVYLTVSLWQKLTRPAEVLPPKVIPEVPVVSVGEMHRVEREWADKFTTIRESLARLEKDIIGLRQQCQGWFTQEDMGRREMGERLASLEAKAGRMWRGRPPEEGGE